ncbi:TPA: hypothetical protein ACPVZH_004957 [Vibrio parahaemolyticus]
MFKLMQFKEDTAVFVEKMRQLLADGQKPRAARFLATAFCNYYRGESQVSIQLSEIDCIDEEHQHLFFNMMLLRSYGFRGDSELHELYLQCKKCI